MSPAEIDRLMAEADDIMDFGVSIGIDPDDDTAETYARLLAAWAQHCAKAARNEREGELADEALIDEEGE